MITVTIGNSYSKIVGLSPHQDRELRDLLSYTVGGSSAYFSGYGPRKRSLLSKRGEFPTGLLYRVKDYLKAETFSESPRKIKYIETRKRPNKGIYTFVPNSTIPYEDQVAAVSAAVLSHRGIIAMPTGTGKSYVIALICGELKVRTLIVVPSLEIKKQLKANINCDWIDVENIDSPALKTAKDYDMLIIDEAHHTAAKTYRKLNKNAWNNIYYRFFLTATPFRNDPEEELLFESIAGEVIFNLSYKDAVKKGYIAPVKAFYVELPKQATNAITWPQVYSELVVNNDYRNQVISNLLLYAGGISTLCLVKEVKHGYNISGKSIMHRFVHGEDEESRDYIRQFSANEIVALIGTEGILGEGIDTKPCEIVIIAGLGKAKSAFMQKVGRAVRKYPGKESAKVIIFKDSSHKFTLRHFKEQCKILLDEFGVKPVKLNLEDIL